jgi:hypothetical protein
MDTMVISRTLEEKNKRRAWHNQALANTRLEGHVPTPEFLADCEAVIEGTLSREEARARSLARAFVAARCATRHTARK